jgi:hypothetical protein
LSVWYFSLFVVVGGKFLCFLLFPREQDGDDDAMQIGLRRSSRKRIWVWSC